MITEYIKGDLLQVSEGYIGHGVNCKGVMGSGIAKQIRDKYPEVFVIYSSLCDLYKPEELLGTAQNVVVNNDLTIWNIFSQLNYGKDKKRYASLKAIRSSFEYINEWMKQNKVQTLNIPKIGAGLGGLKWEDVERVINEVTPDINIIVYEL